MPHEPVVLILAATLVVLKILCTKPLSTGFTQEPMRNQDGALGRAICDERAPVSS
jgi:hypothetical protein